MNTVQLNFSIRDCLNPFGSPVYKGKRTQDDKYYKWFLERNPICCVPNCGQLSTRDHVICGRSRNSRASDYLIVNLCTWHNTNRGGVKEFEERHGVDFARIIETNLTAYCTYIGLTGSFGSLGDVEKSIKEHKSLRKAA